MQIAYIKTLYDIMKNDTNVFSLLSDSGTDYDSMMQRDMPQQCFNFGIAEQNKVAIASGMALSGKIPYVYTSGAFLAYRSFEFIRNDVCYQNQNVKLIGMGSGTAWRTLGPSHHTTEDISVLRVLPNLTILSPATPNEAIACTKLAYQHKGPVYIRMGMSAEQEFFPIEHNITIGGSSKVLEGKNVAVFVTGSILSEVVEASEILSKANINISVYNMHSIKPLDTKRIIDVASENDLIFTVEEHNVLGGLGSAISEVLTEYKLNKTFVKIGINDKFASGYGTQKDVRCANNLDCQNIAITIQNAYNKEFSNE